MYSTISIGDISATLTENLELGKLDQSRHMLCNDAIAKLRSFMLLGDKGKASVISTFEKQLKLFSLPVIRNATDDNSFDFKDMRRKKMTIYLSVEPKDVKIASLILNLFFNCAIKINLSENPDFKPELKYNLLMILDEFPAIGIFLMSKRQQAISRATNCSYLRIFQNVSQLNEIYGMQGRKTLLANHSCKIVFAPNEQDNAEYFSNEIAYITTHSVSESRNQGLRVSSHAESASQAKRALMLPQELKQMPFIVLLNGENPIKCEKALYFNDPYFMKKLISLSPTLQLYAQDNKLPTKEALGIAMSKNELAIDIMTSI